MKPQIIIALTVLFATAAVRAQTLSDYQGVINSQSPYYYNTLDNTLAPMVGTGTFTANGTAFATDLWGNPNDAVSFSASTDQLSDPTGNDIISGSGTPTPVGSMSLLFYTPNTDLSGTTGQYIFSNGDTTAGTTAGTGEFAMEMTGGNLALKVVNKTYTILSPLTGGTWYYFAATWNLNGTTAGVNGLSYYLGEAGGTLSSTFLQKGGSGNFSSTENFGDGGAFALSGHQAGGSGGFQVSGNPGIVDELATWDTQLSSDQITSQFDTLITPVPEPSTGVLFGAGGLLVLFWTRRFGRGQAAAKN